MVRSNDLTKKPVGRSLVNLTIPMVFGMFSMMAFNLADTFFVSRLGTKELAAMTFTFPVVMVIISIALGIGTGVSSVISRSVGRGGTDRLKRITLDSIILSVLVGLLFIILGLVTMRPVFMAMGATEDIYALIKQYMTIWYLGVGFVIIPIIGNHALRGAGDTLIPGIIMAIASVLNVMIDPILIFGLFGFPRMELAGAALATVLTRGLTLILTLYVLYHKKHMIGLMTLRFKEIIASWKRVLYIGLPASATNITFSLTMAVITRLVASFGPAAVAAVGAATRIESLALMVYFSMMTALVPFFGQNWGAGKIDRVYQAQSKSNLFSMAWGAGCFIIFILFGKILGGFFTEDPRIIRWITLFLGISSLSYGLRGITMVSVSMFNAVNMPLRATALNFIRMFALYIPLAYLGSRYFGMTGIFAGMTISNFVAGALSLFWIKNICMHCEMHAYLQKHS